MVSTCFWSAYHRNCFQKREKTTLGLWSHAFIYSCILYIHTDVFNRLTLFRRPLCKRTVAGACSVGSLQWRGWVEWSQWRLWSCKAGNIPCALSVCHVVNRSRSQVVLHGHPVFLLIQENDGWGSSFLWSVQYLIRGFVSIRGGVELLIPLIMRL